MFLVKCERGEGRTWGCLGSAEDTTVPQGTEGAVLPWTEPGGALGFLSNGGCCRHPGAELRDWTGRESEGRCAFSLLLASLGSFSHRNRVRKCVLDLN